MVKRDGRCRSPSKKKGPKPETLTDRDIRALMAHESYERTASGAIRRRGKVVVR